MDPEKLKKLQKRAQENRELSYQRMMKKRLDSPQNRTREYMRHLRVSNRCGSHVNCFRGTYHPDKPDDHEDMKYEVWKQLRKWKHDVIVEPIFNNGKRGDVLDLTTGVLYEITFSETKKMLNNKTKDYPELYEVRRVNAKKKFSEEMLL